MFLTSWVETLSAVEVRTEALVGDWEKEDEEEIVPDITAPELDDMRMAESSHDGYLFLDASQLRRVGLFGDEETLPGEDHVRIVMAIDSLNHGSAGAEDPVDSEGVLRKSSRFHFCSVFPGKQIVKAGEEEPGTSTPSLSYLLDSQAVLGRRDVRPQRGAALPAEIRGA
jgi:hypothetical protein